MMCRISRTFKNTILFIILLGLVLKFQDLRHFTQEYQKRLNDQAEVQMVVNGGQNNDVLPDHELLALKQVGGKRAYETNSNVTYLARLAEKFPEKIRNYYWDSERPFLQAQGKARFFEYVEKTFNDQSEDFKCKMRRLNETWHQRLPPAIIIGCKKCGTTFLKDVLIRHPFVAMAETENGHFIMREKFEQGWPFYRSEMAYSFADQITMEKSPLYWPVTGAPKRIYDYNPDVKLILAVRDPACRIASDFFFGQSVVGYVDSNLTFEDAMTNPELKHVHDFLGGPSKYGPIMKNWLKYFPLENFKIIRNEDMLSYQGVKEVLADLENFLGIPHGVKVVQGAGREVCITQPIPTRNFCFNVTKAEDLPCKYYRKYPDVMKSLHDEYMPYAEEFSQLLNRDFHW